VLVTYLVSSTSPASDLERCVEQHIRTWVFPRPTGGRIATVTYPFVLGGRTATDVRRSSALNSLGSPSSRRVEVSTDQGLT